jgi:transcriptional regulator with XRE-family HTH domain
VTRPGEAIQDVGAFIRQQRMAASKSVRDLARAAGMSNPYLSQVERGIRRPSAEILQQIARALEISAETLDVRAGILDEPQLRRTSVPEAVNTDPGLTPEQRASLLSVYRTFLAANDGTTDSSGE